MRTNSLFAKVRETVEDLSSTFDHAEYGDVNVNGLGQCVFVLVFCKTRDPAPRDF